MVKALPNKAIEEFVAIYHREFGQQLGMKDGKEKSEKVYSYFKTLIGLGSQNSNLPRKEVHRHDKQDVSTGIRQKKT